MTAHSKNISPHSHDTAEQPIQSDYTVGNYLIREKIGQGSFATVYKAQHKVTGHLVAIKAVLRSKLTKKLLENLESEISILKGIRHDYIVGLSECQQTDTHIYLVMDYCTMGDLSQYINEIRKSTTRKGPLGGLPENTLRHFLRQLASALQFLRSKNLVHRDIKPQNLLLVSPHQNNGQSSTASSSTSISDLPILQVADFGFARFLPNASMADTLCGSPLYMGPEILSYQKYDATADLWSVGAVLYEMMTGRPPFRAQNHLELLKRIQEGKDVIRFPAAKMMDGQSPWTGDDLKDLTRKLLKKDPTERLSFEKFFTHPAISFSTTTMAKPLTFHTYPVGSSHASTSSSITPPRPISRKYHHPQQDFANAYEPPPFAQNSSISCSPTSQNQTRYHRDTNNDNTSPIHLHGQSGKAVDLNDLQLESRLTIEQTTQLGEDDDVLRGYVVLDKRIIVTNQFADEINGSPHNDNKEQYLTRRQSMEQLAIQRRKSSSSLSSAASSLASNQTGYPPSSTSPNTPPFSATSHEKRISTGSAGFALTKALINASERLFGTGHSPPNCNNLQQTMIGSPRGYLLMGTPSDYPSCSYNNNNNNNIGYSGDTNNNHNEDNKTMVMIEKVACMGHAVAKFADDKFDIFMNGGNGGNGGGLLGVPNDPIIPAEALVLHLKALALLELGLDMAKEYWHRRRTDNQWRHDRQQQTPSPSATRLNDAVQWMRERFNECLDKASIEKSKCDSSVDSSHDLSSSSSSGNNPCVEQLLYDKALEMSRAAAVHELVGENIVKCEQDYWPAIWMLEAILEVGDDKDMVIEEGDRKIINNFIDSIQQRTSVLQKKLLNQNDQQYLNHYLISNNNRYGIPPNASN